MLDLFGKNPEFFVAGNYSRPRSSAFALIIVIVPPADRDRSVQRSPRSSIGALGTVVFGVVVAVLAGAFVLAVLRTLDVDVVVVVFLVAIVVGDRPGSCSSCVPAGRDCSSPTWPWPTCVFVGLFLFGSRTAELVVGRIGEGSR